MRLYRAHGLGNDYLIAEGHPTSPLVVALCHRHRGVGSDGILEPIDGRDGAEFGLRIHNPDGSEAEKSGNGLRIFAHWLHHKRGAPAQFTVWTAGGIVRCDVDGDVVTVDMGLGFVFPERGASGVVTVPVNVGNPHAVVFCGTIPGNWRALGAQIEQSVPGRTNVQFVTARSGIAEARIWERGAGETMSSGSSACAIAIAGVASGKLASPVTVRMGGGDLSVDVGECQPVVGAATYCAPVRLRGPVEAVGEILVETSWLQARA